MNWIVTYEGHQIGPTFPTEKAAKAYKNRVFSNDKKARVEKCS